MMGKNEEVCDAHTEGDECPYCIIDNLRAEAQTHFDEVGRLNEELASCNAEGVADLEMRFELERDEAARLQLVAGRYQFMWEAAQLCLNKIDDHLEYDTPKHKTFATIQTEVQKHLDIYTEAVSKPKSQLGK